MGSLSSNSNIANSTVIPFNPQAGATYTLQAGDSNKIITLTNAGGCTVKGNPTLLGPGFHCWIEARNNAANLITQFAAEKFFINGATTAGVNSFNLSPQNVQTAIGWDDVVHIATDGTDWHVIQGDPILTSSLALVTPALGAATATSINFGQTSLNNYTEGTWTPTDASGAGLTFIGIDATYTRIGRMFVASYQLAFPATASGANAQISGLPFTLNAGSSSRQGTINFSPVAGVCAAMYPTAGTTNFLLIIATGGGQTTNVSMSTFQNRGQVISFV